MGRHCSIIALPCPWLPLVIVKTSAISACGRWAGSTMPIPVLAQMEIQMRHALRTLVIGGLCTVIAGCASAPQAPSVDIVGSSVAAVAATMVAQTAAAASPTPPPPTVTPTASLVPTLAETETPSGPPRRPQTVADGVQCWLGGPGAPNILETHINHGKAVDLLGIGDTPGWFIIRDPYFHRPCWILGTDLKFFQTPDPSQLPVMTPGIPGPGQ